MERISKWMVIGVVLAGLSACAASPEEEGVGPAGKDTGVGDTRQRVDAGGKMDVKSMLSDKNSPLSKRVFYFEFDSSELSTEDREALNAHAEFLANHPEISVVMEGHADERGTREYNMALGERRAKAVMQLLVLQGASRDQLQSISFGEERPVALGHDESGWSVNRRAELLYSGY